MAVPLQDELIGDGRGYEELKAWMKIEGDVP